MTEHISLRMRLRNHTITWNEEEVHEGDRVVEETLLEEDEENVFSYINGLRYAIKDEINMMSVMTVEDAYQFSLKVEEKLARKHIQQGRGKGSIPRKSKGFNHDRAHQSKDEAEKPHNHSE